MAKPHDAAMKQLIDAWSPQWTSLLCQQADLPPDMPAEPLDADLSVASNQSDKLFRLDGGRAGLLHLELETSWAGGQALEDLWLYNVLADHRYGGPVYSVLMLLRREADSPQITGEWRRVGANNRKIHEFHYTPVRVWGLPCEPLLTGPLGTLPLAVLTDEANRDIRQTAARIEGRLQQEAPTPATGSSLVTACTLLLGIRMDREQALRVFTGARTMRDSSVYQGILEEGRGEGELIALRRMLRRQGTGRFGAPRAEQEAQLTSIANVARLERIIDRIPSAADWNDLLNTP